MKHRVFYVGVLTVFCGGLVALGGVQTVKSVSPSPEPVVASSVLQGNQTCMDDNGSVCMPVLMKGSYNTGNNFKNVDFAIDTGSFTTIVPQSLANELNLTHGSLAWIEGFGAKQTDGYWSVVELVINGEKYPYVPCIVIPDQDTLGSPVLGIDFFRLNDLSLSIDAKQDTVEITSGANPT